MARVSLTLVVLALAACEHAAPARTRKKRAPVAKGADTAALRSCEFAPYRPLRLTPIYPPEAKRLRQHSAVTARVRLNDSGVVEQACGDGPPLLRAAAESALHWRFDVPRLNGEPILYIEESLRLDFVLDPPNSPRSRPPGTSP